MKFAKIAVLYLKFFVPLWAVSTVGWYAFCFVRNYYHFWPIPPLSWQSAADGMLPDALVGTAFAFCVEYLKRQEAEQKKRATQEAQQVEG